MELAAGNVCLLGAPSVGAGQLGGIRTTWRVDSKNDGVVRELKCEESD